MFWCPCILGIRVILNLTDDLTIKVFIKEGNEFLPLDPDKAYQVSTLSFLSRGGNGFDVSGTGFEKFCTTV